MDPTTILSGKGIADQDVSALSVTIGMGEFGYMLYSYTLSAAQIFQIMTAAMASIRVGYNQLECVFDNGKLYANSLDSQWEYKLLESADDNFGAVIFYFYDFAEGMPLKEIAYISKITACIGTYLDGELALKDCAVEKINIPPKNKPFEDHGFSFSHSELARAFRNSVIIEVPCQTTLNGTRIKLPSWYKTGLSSKDSVTSTARRNPRHFGECNMAAAIYGSYDCPEVWTLRRFRDLSLTRNRYGRMIIRIYHAVSPTLIKCLSRNKRFRQFGRKRLNGLVIRLKAMGFSDTPYEDP